LSPSPQKKDNEDITAMFNNKIP